MRCPPMDAVSKKVGRTQRSEFRFPRALCCAAEQTDQRVGLGCGNSFSGCTGPRNLRASCGATGSEPSSCPCACRPAKLTAGRPSRKPSSESPIAVVPSATALSSISLSTVEADRLLVCKYALVDAFTNTCEALMTSSGSRRLSFSAPLVRAEGSSGGKAASAARGGSGANTTGSWSWTAVRISTSTCEENARKREKARQRGGR